MQSNSSDLIWFNHLLFFNNKSEIMKYFLQYVYCTWILTWSQRVTISAAAECKAAVYIHEISEAMFWTLRNITYDWGSSDDYRLHRKAQQANFGGLYTGMNIHTGEKVSVKVYNREQYSPAHINNELAILQSICGSPNVIKLVDVLRDTVDEERPMAVLERIDKISSYLEPAIDRPITAQDIQHFMWELLQPLIFLHQKRRIIHRGINPSIVAVDTSTMQIKLIDFQSATYLIKGRRHSYHSPSDATVGTSCYRAPEVLLGIEKQTPMMDMWALGTMLAELVFQKRPFFEGCAVATSLGEEFASIVKVLGHRGLNRFTHKYNVSIPVELIYEKSNPPYVHKNINTYFDSLITPSNEHLATKDALSLIGSLLRYDYIARRKGTEVFYSKYFRSLREERGIVDGSDPWLTDR
jgi:casein kinase II subunit alpha